jgi:hypothetical protein
VVRRDVVDDGEADGSSGASWGGLLLRRASATVSGGELAIAAVWWLIEHGVRSRRGCEMREGEWRAQFGARSAPFIVASSSGGWSR